MSTVKFETHVEIDMDDLANELGFKTTKALKTELIQFALEEIYDVAHRNSLNDVWGTKNLNPTVSSQNILDAARECLRLKKPIEQKKIKSP